ncbi:MAG TPA: hypothetical protein VF163_13025 [Micromonosporaceae bacterium]
MMYGYWSGWWGWMMLMPLFWVAVIAVATWAVIRFAQRPSEPSVQPPPRQTPQEILDRRFASGDIDVDTYVQARDQLAGRGPRSPGGSGET